MPSPLKTAILPVAFVGGTLEGAARGVAQTVGALGSTVLRTGTEGGREVWAMWQGASLPTGGKAALTPFVFLFGTAKGVVGGVQGVILAVAGTAVGTLTGGVQACAAVLAPAAGEAE